jgi:hypothetical protein
MKRVGLIPSVIEGGRMSCIFYSTVEKGLIFLCETSYEKNPNATVKKKLTHLSEISVVNFVDILTVTLRHVVL